MSRKAMFFPVLLFFAAYAVAGDAPQAGPSIPVAPHTAVVEARDAGGKLIGLRYVYTSADGSAAEFRTPGALQYFLDTNDQVEVALDDDTLLYNKAPMPPGRAAGLKRVSSDCVTHYGAHGLMQVACSDGGTMLGHPVVKSEATIRNGESVITKRKHAIKDLGWLPLLEEDVIDGKVTRTRRTLELKLGEPPRHVFTVPAKYKKATLVEFWEARHLHEGEPMKDDERRALEQKMQHWERDSAAWGNTKWKQ